jgi:LysR family transcriptional regulator, low CO2-responsive transcriptional regulator
VALFWTTLRTVFEQCRLFRDLGLEGSLKKAAEKNGITASAASQQLRDMEERVGDVLIDRSQRPLRLTDAGRLYFELCSEVVRLHNDFSDRLVELKGSDPRRVIRLAAIYSGLWEIAGMKQLYEQSTSAAQLKIEYCRPEAVYSAVLNGQADFGIVSYPEEMPEITTIPWRQEKMVVAVSPRHPLAAKTYVRASELTGLRLVSFDPELPIQKDINAYLKGCGVQLQTAAHFDSIALVKEAVAVGEGIGILPEVMIRQEVEMKRLLLVDLVNPTLYRPVSIIHRKERKISPQDSVLLVLLEKYGKR